MSEISNVTQQADKSMKVKMVKIDGANTVKKDSLVWSYDEYNKSAYAALVKTNTGIA